MRGRLVQLPLPLTMSLACLWLVTTAPAQDVGQGPPDHVGKQHSTAGVPASGKFTESMHASMVKMTEEMHRLEMTGNPDRDFLAMMILHHEGAVEMARLVLVYGSDPLVRRLAEEIIASQQAEITAMRARLAILRKGGDMDPGGFPALHGTRGPAPDTSKKVTH